MAIRRAFALATICLFTLAANAQTTTPASRPTSRPGGAVTAPEKRDVAGRRVELSCGRLFIPEGSAATDSVDCMLWFRGAAWCVEQEFEAANAGGVLFVWDESKRKLGFADETAADALISEIEHALGEQKVGSGKIGRICLGSFSGGYVSLLDLLRFEPFRARVTDVVLADSLYGPRGTADFAKFDSALEPFLAFAKRAAAGEGTFVYSQLFPPEPQHRGNGTTVSAMWLIDRCHATRVEVDDRLPDGRRLLYRAEKAGFHVLGVAGMTNQDHADHLYHLSTLLRYTSFCKGR